MSDSPATGLPEFTTARETARLLDCSCETAKKLLGKPDAEVRWNLRGNLPVWRSERMWTLFRERQNATWKAVITPA